MYTIGSFTSIIPYRDQESAFKKVVILVAKGSEFVDFSTITVRNVARGDPIRITDRPTPIIPNG